MDDDLDQVQLIKLGVGLQLGPLGVCSPRCGAPSGRARTAATPGAPSQTERRRSTRCCPIPPGECCSERRGVTASSARRPGADYRAACQTEKSGSASATKLSYRGRQSRSFRATRWRTALALTTDLPIGLAMVSQFLCR